MSFATWIGVNIFPGLSPDKTWIRVFTMSIGWTKLVATQPLIEPIAKFIKIYGFATF